MSSVPLFPPGTVIDGRFELRRVLGRGGFGAVHCAYQRELQREVALKLIFTHKIHNFEAFAEEAVLGAQQGDNPAILTVFEVGADQSHGVYFIAMEYFRGDDLKKYVQDNGPMKPDIVGRVMLKIARGLIPLHEKNIFHLDFKPTNLMLAIGPEFKLLIKILDWGIAQRERDGLPITSKAWTDAWAAPEQLIGGRVSAATDVFSLGATAWSLATGLSPFDVGRNQQELVKRELSADIFDRRSPLFQMPRLDEFIPGFPSPLAEVINKALSYRPEDRYRDAQELETALVRASRYAVAEDTSAVDTSPTLREQDVGAFLLLQSEQVDLRGTPFIHPQEKADSDRRPSGKEEIDEIEWVIKEPAKSKGTRRTRRMRELATAALLILSLAVPTADYRSAPVGEMPVRVIRQPVGKASDPPAVKRIVQGTQEPSRTQRIDDQSPRLPARHGTRLAGRQNNRTAENGRGQISRLASSSPYSAANSQDIFHAAGYEGSGYMTEVPVIHIPEVEIRPIRSYPVDMPVILEASERSIGSSLVYRDNSITARASASSSVSVSVIISP